jgi:transcriptional regulator with PAS, ATPase and Fis domain
MASVWLLLGKTRYPATFYQTFKGKASITNVPFDLTLDFLPELLRAPDAHWQHLSAQSPGEVAGFEKIVGDSKPIRLAVGRAQRAAIRSVPVLLLGESGTGKEMFARAIHDASARRSGPFIVINCAAIARELLESELFGHTKGAFSGATADRKGAFEEADGGTLFLDEIGECDLDLQAKLLRVLQPLSDSGPCKRAYRRVGESKDRMTDVRVIAATNRDLVKAIQDGRFRDDLYYRLAVVTIGLPALRERKTDIPKIAEVKMQQINREFMSGEPGYRDKKLSDSAISFVKRYGWPGNVRQLHNALLQAAVMANGTVLHRDDILAAVGTMPDVETGRDGSLDEELGNGFDLEEHLNNIRKHYLRRAMEESRGVKAEASRMLGFTNYQTLDAQLKRLNVTGNWK